MKIKRFFLSLMLLIATMCVLTGCGECKHEYSSKITKAATVLETGTRTYTCNLCGDSYTETIEAIQSNWSIHGQIDEFGEELKDKNEQYLAGTFSGKYENKYGSNGTLYATVFFRPYKKNSGGYGTLGIYIRLSEKGYHNASFSNSDGVSLKIKDSNGNMETYSLLPIGGKAGFIGTEYYTSGEDLSVSDEEELLETLLTSSETNMAVTLSTQPGVSYTFKVDNVGLAEMIESIV